MYVFFSLMWLILGIVGLLAGGHVLAIIGLVNSSVWAVGNMLSLER